MASSMVLNSGIRATGVAERGGVASVRSHCPPRGGAVAPGVACRAACFGAVSSSRSSFVGTHVPQQVVRAVGRQARGARSRGAFRVDAMIREIPVFPLSVVAMPQATVPLHIFEARYRVLFNTLLDGAERVEDDLVQKDSPYVGTREFGMCFIDNQGQMASTGATLHIDQHEQLPDGRLLIVNKGVQRFKVLDVVQERPVMICRVEMLETEVGSSPEIDALADEVRSIFRDTMVLGMKMKGRPEPDEPEELTSLGAVDLSFWLASMFDAPMEQQSLLEMDSVLDRLQREKAVLQDTLQYLRAATALQGAFKTTEGEGEDGPINPPKGGPD